MMLRMNKQGCEVKIYKEHFVVDPIKYAPMKFINYSPNSIINAMVIPDVWVKCTKKKINIKQEEKDFRKNNNIMFN